MSLVACELAQYSFPPAYDVVLTAGLIGGPMMPIHRSDHRPVRLQRRCSSCGDDERWPPGWGLLAAVALSIGAWIILLAAGAALARLIMR